MWAIVNLNTLSEEQLDEVAALLVEGFRDLAPTAWPTITAARREVQEALAPDRIGRVAIAEDGAVLGWIGGISQYGGNAWELHPLVVREEYRGQGIGRALVCDLEKEISRRGGITLWVGTDDEDDRTSLAGVDLFPDPLEHLARLEDLRGHPFSFYRKLGFVVTGVLPDANGFGKPDIFMVKRIGGFPESPQEGREEPTSMNQPHRASND